MHVVHKTPPLRPAPPVEPGRKPAADRRQTQRSGAFAELMAERLAGEIKFSAHAQTRLKAAQSGLSVERLESLRNAVDLAARKGARDSLVLFRDLALIVSVRNRTVVTAIEGSRLKENVFTNIDSAVIVE